MKKYTFILKKITLIIIVVFCISTFSSCKKEEETYYDIIEMPRDIEYGILTSDAYVAYGEFYYFPDEIKTALKKENKGCMSKPDISSLSTKGRVLLDNKYYMAANYNSSIVGKDKFVFGYFDVEEESYKIIHTFESISNSVTLKKIGKHLVLSTDDYYLLFNSDSEKLALTIELKEEWIKKLGSTHFMYMTEDGFVIYDSMLNCYKVPANVSLDDYKSGSIYFFDLWGDYLRYFDANHNQIFINYKTLQLSDFDKYKEEQKNNNTSTPDNNEEKENSCYTSEDTACIVYNGVEYEYTMEYMKESHKIITDVERLCDTEVRFTDAFIDNGEMFVQIGNDDSFFGFYTTGRTVPLIFRFNVDTKTFSYVGSSGQIYSRVVKMFPLEDE